MGCPTPYQRLLIVWACRISLHNVKAISFSGFYTTSVISMPPLEIIDLTSPSCATDEDSGTGIEPNSSQKQESLKKRKRKAKYNPSATNPQSRQNSPGSQIELTSPRKRRRPEDLSSNVGCDKQVGDADTPNTFFIDLNPTPLPPARQTATETLSEDKQTTEKLLVPSHVTVLGSTPVEIMAQHLPDEDDEDFIDYLDYEDTKVSLLWSS